MTIIPSNITFLNKQQYAPLINSLFDKINNFIHYAKQNINKLNYPFWNIKCIGYLIRISKHETSLGMLPLYFTGTHFFAAVNDCIVPLNMQRISNDDVIFVEAFHGIYLVRLFDMNL